MKNIVLVIAFAVAGAITGVFAASANVDNENWGAVDCPDGYVCVTIKEYELHWDVCPIDPNFTPTPTETPNGDPTPTPTTEVTPVPTDKPTKEPKQACNRGIGNLEEGCDPGNSFGQGNGGGRPAGEDRHESEGPPGNQHKSDNGNHKGGGKK